MKTEKGIVASLVAMLMLPCASTEASAQTQYATMEMKQFSVQKHYSRTAQIGNPAFLTGKQFLHVPDDGIPRSEIGSVPYFEFFANLYQNVPATAKPENWEPLTAWRGFSVYRLNPDGTVPEGLNAAHLFYMPSTNSLVYVVDGMELPELGIVGNALPYFQARPAMYEPKGPLFAVRLPKEVQVGNETFRYCETGEQPVFTVYNGVTHLMFASWEDYRAAQAYPNWAGKVVESDVYAKAGMFCVPKQGAEVVVTYEFPSNRRIEGMYAFGDYYGRIPLSGSNGSLALGAVQTVYGAQGGRELWVDASRREVRSAPGWHYSVAVGNGEATAVAHAPFSGLTDIPHERSDRVLRLGDALHRQEAVWVARDGSITPWITFPQGEVGVQAHQVPGGNGDWWWLVSIRGGTQHANGEMTGSTHTILRLLHARTGRTLYEYEMPHQTASGNALASARPAVAFSPNEPGGAALYLTTRRTGKLFRLHLATRTLQEVAVPQSGGTCGAVDVAVDTANALILANVWCFSGGWQSSVTERVGSVVAFGYAPAGGVPPVRYQTPVGKGPWSLTIERVGGVNYAFVSNSSSPGSTVSVVRVATGQEVHRVPVNMQPTGIAVVPR